VAGGARVAALVATCTYRMLRRTDTGSRRSKLLTPIALWNGTVNKCDRSWNNWCRQRYQRGEPVAAYLSGGIDSSCVTAIATRLHDRPVHTFSMHFGAQYPSEIEFANLVATHCGTVHHILEVSPSKFGSCYRKRWRRWTIRWGKA
jgi:hypothetical protein